MKWLLDFIRPPEDADWKAVNRWRWNISMTMMAFGACILYSASPWGYALAGDMKKEISKAIEPIAQKQEQQGRQLDAVGKLLTESLAAQVATQIRLTVSKRCKTTGAVEREELNREIDRLQSEYFRYKSERYMAPQCGEL